MPRASTSLVTYSSSEDEVKGKEERPTKKPRLLPPLSKTLVPEVPIDNPALHQGRKRSTPHIEGQWATHVYVPVIINPKERLGALLKDALSQARKYENLWSIGLNESEGTGDTELHISLTRPTFIRTHQREDIKRAVQEVAKKTSSCVFSAIPVHCTDGQQFHSVIFDIFSVNERRKN